MDIMKKSFAIFVLCISILLCLEGFEYILLDDTASYSRLMMHQLYNEDENIDILFVGSSHVYRSLIPEITDDIFKTNTFNVGTSSQGMDGSLAIIKEALKYHDIKEIYLDVYYGIAVLDDYKEREQMTATYILSDYMKPSLNKYTFLVNASGKEHYVNGFIPARRNWQKIFDIRYVKELIEKKNSVSYKNFTWIKSGNSSEYYVDRGFVANNESSEANTSWGEAAYNSIELDRISKDWEKSLKEIVKFCKKKQIELVLYMAPMPDWTLIGVKNYDQYTNMVKDMAKELDVEYYDFNLCKAEYFSCSDKKLFKDEDHLNTLGAEAFSKIFAEFFEEKYEQEALFHSSFNEKIKAKEPMVYGISNASIEGNKDIKNIRIISTRDIGIEYEVTIENVNGDYCLVQDFSENKEISLPMEVVGNLYIRWRNKEDVSENEILKIPYGI